VATPGRRRVEELLRWTEAELASSDQVDQAALFRFAAVPPEGIAPSRFFLGPQWRGPFVDSAEPLIDLAGLPTGRPLWGGLQVPGRGGEAPET
jgi:hypothetical protein